MKREWSETDTIQSRYQMRKEHKQLRWHKVKQHKWKHKRRGQLFPNIFPHEQVREMMQKLNNAAIALY